MRKERSLRVIPLLFVSFLCALSMLVVRAAEGQIAAADPAKADASPEKTSDYKEPGVSEEVVAISPPHGEQFAATDGSARLDRCGGSSGRQQALRVCGELVRIAKRHRRALVEEPQVADLVAYRPVGCRRGQ